MKYCEECKKKYPDNEAFCEECGNKLTEFVKQPTVKHEQKNKEKVHEKKIDKEIKHSIPEKSKVMIGVLLVIVFILIISLFSNSNNSVQQSNPSTSGSASSNQLTNTNNCRDVQEAYQEQEAYQTPLSYSVLSSSLKEEWELQKGYYYRYDVTVSNSDDNSGQFTVNFALQTSKHGTLSNSSTQYISPHSTQIFEKIFDTDMGEQVSGSHSVVPPTKTEYRTVTKYRIVQKCN